LGNANNGIDATNGGGSLIENNKVLNSGNFDLYDPATDEIWLNNKYGTSSL
jgi:hypothetical protein